MFHVFAIPGVIGALATIFLVRFGGCRRTIFDPVRNVESAVAGSMNRPVRSTRPAPRCSSSTCRTTSSRRARRSSSRRAGASSPRSSGSWKPRAAGACRSSTPRTSTVPAGPTGDPPRAVPAGGRRGGPRRRRARGGDPPRAHAAPGGAGDEEAPLQLLLRHRPGDHPARTRGGDRGPHRDDHRVLRARHGPRRPRTRLSLPGGLRRVRVLRLPRPRGRAPCPPPRCTWPPCG